MPLETSEGRVITAHASKQSKVNLKIFQAHTSVLIPFLAFPVLPFMSTLKVALVVVLVLVLLERRGWTLPLAMKRLRSRLAGRYRYTTTKRVIARRQKLN